MGLGGSTMSHPEMQYESHHASPPYMDMNVIFRDGIPKMMKVADDMHRMTDYIMDLRNMTIGLVIISAIGVVGFLIIRYLHGRHNRKSRRRSLRKTCSHDDQPSLPRYYYQSQYQPDPWERPKSTFSHHSLDEKKALDTRGSPEERKAMGVPNGTLSYKPYSSMIPPTDDSLDESRRIDDSFSSSKATSIPNPMLITTPMSNKRTLDPVKLTVDDLPYADNSS